MLAKKLMVRPGSRVAVLGAPPTIDLVLANGAVPSERGLADIVLVYTRDRAALARALPKAMKRVADGGVLWEGGGYEKDDHACSKTLTRSGRRAGEKPRIDSSFTM